MESSCWCPQPALRVHKGCKSAMEHRSTIARSRACDRKRMQLLSLYAGLIGLLVLTLAFMLGSRR